MTDATEKKPDLEALSKAATGGTWYGSGTGHLCAKGLPHGSRVLTCDAQHSEKDVMFIVALVNAYRSGDLIDLDTHEAAIKAAREDERERCAEAAEAACDNIARNYDALTKCKTKYHPTWIQEIGKGFARLCREDAPQAIRALTDATQETTND